MPITAPHTLNSHPTTIAFTKGHGTQNDFIILPDPEAQLSLTPQLIATLCDRQRGIGADGIPGSPPPAPSAAPGS